MWLASAAALLMTLAMSAATNGPLLRVIEPESYPDECVDKVERFETVVLEFDTTSIGEPLNAAIVESTNDCLNEAALRVISEMRFLQMEGQLGLTPRKNLRAALRFDRIKSALAPERAFRSGVRRRLDRVLKGLERGGDSAKALSRLEKVEEKFGDDFSLAEFAAHRMLRAAAHADHGDLEGALQDLRVAEETGVIEAALPVYGMNLEKLRQDLKIANKK